MAKVYMLTQLSGTRDGVDWPGRGEQVDLPDAEAAQLVTAGIASQDKPDMRNRVLTTHDDVEAAVVAEPVETATVKNQPAKPAAKKA